MAVIYNAQGKKKDVASQPTEQPLAPSAPAAGGAAPQATAAPKQAGGGFTDLSTYLKANKKGIENIASNLASNAVGKVDTTVKGPEVASIGNTTVDLAGDTSGAVKDLGKTYDTTTYENELANSTAGQYQSAGQAVGATSALAAGNINQALSGINGGVRGGIRNLTAFGVQRDPNAQQTFQKAAQDAQANAATLAANSKAAAEKIAQGKKDFTDRMDALKANIADSQNKLLDESARSRVSKRAVGNKDEHSQYLLSDPNAARQWTQDLAASSGDGFTFTPKTTDANISQYMDEFNRTYGKNYYTAGTQAVVGAASPELLRKQAALDSLLSAGGLGKADWTDQALINRKGDTQQQASFDQEGYKKGLAEYIKRNAGYYRQPDDANRDGAPGFIMATTNRALPPEPALIATAPAAPAPAPKKTSYSSGKKNYYSK